MHCENCKKYADCKDGSGLIWPCGGYRPVIITNAQRIRGMSDEELAEYLGNMSGDKCGGVARMMLDWLQQPAEETP